MIDFLQSDWVGDDGLDIISLKNIYIETDEVLPNALHEMMGIKDYSKDEDGIYHVAHHFAFCIKDYFEALAAYNFKPKFSNDHKSIDYTLKIPMSEYYAWYVRQNDTGL